MSCELFVGNLNPDVRVRDLENCFGKYGKIVRCDLKKNYGFIQLADKRDAEQAIRKENDRRLLGSVMTVEWAKGSVGDSGRGNGPSSPRTFRKPRLSPDRFNGRPPVRNRSPLGGGRPPRRDRSPIGRGPIQRSNGFLPRDSVRPEGRQQFSRDNFDNPRFERGPPSAPRDRFQGQDRFNDRGTNRGPPRSIVRGPPPPRENRFNDRGPRNGGFNERRSSFGDRRNFGGGGGGGGGRRF